MQIIVHDCYTIRIKRCATVTFGTNVIVLLIFSRIQRTRPKVNKEK